MDALTDTLADMTLEDEPVEWVPIHEYGESYDPDSVISSPGMVLLPRYDTSWDETDDYAAIGWPEQTDRWPGNVNDDDDDDDEDVTIMDVARSFLAVVAANRATSATVALVALAWLQQRMMP